MQVCFRTQISTLTLTLTHACDYIKQKKYLTPQRDPRTLLRASPDLEINSTEGDGDLEPFLLKNGTPVTVVRWEIETDADDETETLFGSV